MSLTQPRRRTEATWLRALACIASACIPMGACTPLAAAPLSFKDSTALKLTLSAPWSSADLSRAITTHDGFGISLNWIEASGSTTSSHHHGGSHGQPAASELWSFVTYTRLLRRWNTSSSQANIWLDLGAGGVNRLDGGSPDLKQGALNAALAIDAETQRLYLSLGARTLQAQSAARSEASIKAGVALTGADFERIQPWLMVEARGMQGTTTALELIPSLRLLHQRFALDIGASLQGHPHLSLRTTF